MMAPEDTRRLSDCFEFHPPVGDQADRYAAVRGHCKALAGLIVDKCPSSRERSLALTKLEEAMFWANASIARNK